VKPLVGKENSDKKTEKRGEGVGGEKKRE